MGLDETLDGNRHRDCHTSGALPAITKILIRHLLHDHKASELVVRYLPMGHGSEISAPMATAIRSLPGVFNIVNHKHLSYGQCIVILPSR